VGRWQHAPAYLDVVVEMIRGGRQFRTGDATNEVLDGYEVRFGSVSDHRRLELLTWVDWANLRQPFDALQVILPDQAGSWPSEQITTAFHSHCSTTECCCSRQNR
jgi:hypothetical protein